MTAFIPAVQGADSLALVNERLNELIRYTGEIPGGDVDGPASATDNAVARFDGTTGKIVQNSSATVDDNGTASVNTLKLLASPTVTGNVIGELYINTAENSLPEIRINTDTSLTVGAEMFLVGVNKTGVTITDGSVVYISGAQGNRATVALAKADALTTCRLIGMATADIANNAEGLITIMGHVHGFDTSGFTAGDILFVSAATAGAVTNVAPSSPHYSCVVGVALNSTNNGLVHIHPELPLANNTALGTDRVAPSQNAVKTYADTKATAGLVTASGLTMATNKLLGRGTASTGAIEEITLGSTLSLSGTTLSVPNLSGTNTGDQTISISGDVTASGGTGALTATVTKINGTSLAGLATGILKNTTGTGVPSIAVAGDFPTLNQNTTGSAATLTTARSINGVSFNGSADITVTAAAGTLTGTALASGVTTSNLNSVVTVGATSLALGTNGTTRSTIDASGNLTEDFGDWTFKTSATERFYISSGGQIVVSGTDPGGGPSASQVRMGGGQVLIGEYADSPLYKVNGTQVVSARSTGWSAQTATSSKADLGASPTTAQLASFCRALYDAMATHGLIGP
jgi:hypothetical protein